MITRVKRILGTLDGVSDWRINRKHVQSYEMFFVQGRRETTRATDTEQVTATVYVRDGGRIGEASVSLYATQTDAELTDKLTAAVRNARLVRNEDYALPAEGVLVCEQESNFCRLAPRALAARLAAAVFAADHYADGSINALEIFVTRTEHRVVNSRGTDKTQILHGAMIEAIPTWNGGAESVELYEQHNVTELDEAAVTAEIDAKMREVRDRSLAIKPTERPVCDVVLGAKELCSLWSDVRDSLDMQAVYAHANAYATGDRLQSEQATGDRLTLTVCGAIKGSRASAFFDADGTQLVSRTVVRDGVATEYHGAMRFAQYLGLEPTGATSCIEVDAGTMTDAEVTEGAYLACVSLSGLQVDVYNDYIGGEVRLAYYCDGQTRVPVTGISIAGKLSDVLDAMRLSATCTTHEHYHGPAFARCKGFTIV